MFSAGTIQWSWGLDNNHDAPSIVTPGLPDHCIRQATVNLFADMGIAGETLEADLTAASASTDTTPPVSRITIPANGQIVMPGEPPSILGSAIHGTATDVDGVVAGVEVSVDGGLSWHPAEGTTRWSYPWVPRGNGLVTIASRAIDDSGNIQDPVTEMRITVGVPVDPGPGGPVLVVVNGSYAANPFGAYLGEILRAEGLMSFSTIELAVLMDQPAPAAFLAGFELVVLTESALLPEQERAIREYVAGGGALVAMRPPRALADLFGLTFAGRRTETAGTPQFLIFNTDEGPGAGLTVTSLQYHGAADLYTVGDTVTLASLCDDISTPSAHPAAVRRGRAVAFTFDLARSVLLTRQGNPEWTNSEGDAVGAGDVDAPLSYDATGQYPTAAFRAMDMFTRLEGQLWYEPERLAVPQADELQRFFAHVVLDLVGRPMPRVWYLPATHKWLIVNTGDTCNSEPDQQDRTVAAANAFGTMSTYVMKEQIGAASVTRDRHDAWYAAGNDVGVHMVDGTGQQTVQSLTTAYESITKVFANEYGHVARAARNHTVEWVGWADMAAIEARCGARLDLNYYHYFDFRAARAGSFPGIQTPLKVEGSIGYVTGSGLAQRFCDENGRVLPIFQVLTEWADEFFYDNSQERVGAVGFTVPTVLAAIRSMIASAEHGYYSAFVMQTHPARFSPRPGFNDFAREWATEIWTYAKSVGVPMISATRFLDFVETRTAARLRNVTWNGTDLDFELQAPVAGQSLTLMLPAAGLRGVQVNGAPAEYTSEFLMGRHYALVTTAAARARVLATTLYDWRAGLDSQDRNRAHGSRVLQVRESAVSCRFAEGRRRAPSPQRSRCRTFAFPGELPSLFRNGLHKHKFAFGRTGRRPATLGGLITIGLNVVRTDS